MILIADSGASKTDWRLLLDESRVLQIKTQGLSPFFKSTEEMLAEMQHRLLPKLEANTPSKIYFYGTACSSDERRQTVRAALEAVFPEAATVVEHDMLGAARALCGHQPGVACILGTGSNACLFDGRSITGESRNLGFILGDEGSGAFLGKKLLRAFLYEEMPQALADKFAGRYSLSREKVVSELYGSDQPSRYLASFTHFLFRHRAEPFAALLIHEAFTEFLKRHVMYFEESERLPTHFTGSISHYFGDFLRRAAARLGLSVGNIVEKPIAGITLYHQDELKNT